MPFRIETTRSQTQNVLEVVDLAAPVPQAVSARCTEPGTHKNTFSLETLKDLPAGSATLSAGPFDEAGSCESPSSEESGAWVRVSPTCEEGAATSQGKKVGFTEPVDTGAAAKGKLWTVLRDRFAAGGRKGVADTGSQQAAQSAPPAYADQVQSPKACFSQAVTGEVPTAFRDILDADPPQWMPDSSAFACMQCGDAFRPLSCGRHHCRFCGGLFCRSCSSARCLMPVRFRCRDPQRVCDSCYERLEPVQSALVATVSYASQVATHDVTDMSCMRGWLNSPIGLSMQQEIYKATNTLRHYTEQIGMLEPEKSIPDSVLKGAKGLAIITEIKAGIIVTYKVGTGLVVARRVDGTWSSPSAIVSCGLGWGPQVGGELTDFIIVLQTKRAVKAFGGRVHLSMGAGLSAAVGPVGRVAEADLRAGDGGAAACYTYSCSKGAFVGCSLEGNVVATRYAINTNFYGDPCVTGQDILFGPVPRPKAAAPLYAMLSSLFEKVDVQAESEAKVDPQT